MDLELKGKTVLVTGGGAGLGAGICEVFAQEGASVVVNYIVKEEEVFQFVESLKVRFGGEHIAVYGDITKAEDVDAMIQKVEDTFGHLDILVNNAGIWPTTPIAEMTDDEWRKVIDINLNGAFVPLSSAVLGAVFGYMSLWLLCYVYKLLTGKVGMGGGDFKLLAALGAWLGVGVLPVIVFIAALIGVLAAVLLRVAKGQQFAFGPSLAVAGWLVFIANEKVLAALGWWLRASGFSA